MSENWGASGAVRAIPIRSSAFSTPMAVGQTEPGGSLNVSQLPPQTYTLQFSIAKVNPASPSSISAEAVVTWKVDGQPQRRVISIVSGAAISGVCNGVDVKIRDKKTVLGVTGTQYIVQTTLSAGLRGVIQQPPTLGADEGTPHDPNSVLFSVPQDSGVISFYPFLIYPLAPSPVLPDDFQVTLLDGANYVLGYMYPLYSPGWIPLIPGTAKVDIYCKIGENTTPRLVWGIEG